HPGLRQPRLASDCIEGEGIAAAKDFNCVIEKFDFGWHISNIPTIRMVGQLSCGLSRKRSFVEPTSDTCRSATTRRHFSARNSGPKPNRPETMYRPFSGWRVEWNETHREGSPVMAEKFDVEQRWPELF